MNIHPKRIQTTGTGKVIHGPVVYWMSRDQRSEDNWGLLYARSLADKYDTEMAVVFTLASRFLEATLRQYDFMLKGLRETSVKLQEKNIPFYLIVGDPVEKMGEFLSDHSVAHVVYDFDPLRIKQTWQNSLVSKHEIFFYEVDSHNIIPARYASNKREFGAYTLRPKIKRLLAEFLDEFSPLKKQEKNRTFQLQEPDLEKALSTLKINREVEPVKWLIPGMSGAKMVLESFIVEKLSIYDEKRNDPNGNATSNLSPYLHFGQISAQRVALEILKTIPRGPGSDSFLEELIVRKELSDNYCLYTSSYDSLEEIPEWAAKTLREHKKDEREYLYSLEDFENARTHENLWNAAQNEMRKTGKMHGYMRMYWAKKILEWSNSPDEAMEIAVYLNDKYQLDGRDPNGYTGCAWAIAGIHDRAWTERPVYGKIRYMNYNGARRKFNVDEYCNRWNSQ